LNASVAGFLIDECLSAKFADLLRERGYPALATTRTPGLRKRDDYRAARFAPVTNDMYELANVHAGFEVHPGTVFITAGRTKLRDVPYQQRMFTVALDELEDADPMSVAIRVKGPTVDIGLKRYRHSDRS
jgi:hypothetical protein